MKLKGLGEAVFDGFNYTILIVLAFLTIYPIWDSLVISISPLEEYYNSKVHLFPHDLTVEAYKFLLPLSGLWKSYGVTLFITIVGTMLSMALTIMAGYALSKNYLKGQRMLMFLIVLTMLFSGGLIPTYIIVKDTHLMDTLWALIIPTAVNSFYLIILRSFFSSVPESLEESAKIDGCNDVGLLVKIVIPLSMPAIATISLFYGVNRWNEFFSAVMYINDRDKWPLQLFLRAMLFESESSYQGGDDNPFLTGIPVKMATIMVATIPVMLIYPFFQKYFAQGIMVGAVKE
jgi:putative aldouronate transport system permease protein